MKLPIKKKYFDLIKSEDKNMEYRDAHITFICEETGEKLICDIEGVGLTCTAQIVYPDVLKDTTSVWFKIKVRK